MIHGPCDHLSPDSMHMDNGECTKNYPKDYCADTNEPVDGYPKYRRRDNRVTVKVHNIDVDNHWVDTYNPWLVKKYGAYINVYQACMSSKYLYKHIYEGHQT